jgi:hypothetical protein
VGLSRFEIHQIFEKQSRQGSHAKHAYEEDALRHDIKEANFGQVTMNGNLRRTRDDVCTLSIVTFLVITDDCSMGIAVREGIN